MLPNSVSDSRSIFWLWLRLQLSKKLHTLKAKCPPSLIAWPKEVGIRWRGSIPYLQIQVGRTDGRRAMQYPPSATSLRRGTKTDPYCSNLHSNSCSNSNSSLNLDSESPVQTAIFIWYRYQMFGEKSQCAIPTIHPFVFFFCKYDNAHLYILCLFRISFGSVHHEEKTLHHVILPLSKIRYRYALDRGSRPTTSILSLIMASF